MKLYTHKEVYAMLDELHAFIDDLGKGNKLTKPRAPSGIEITEKWLEDVIIESLAIMPNGERRMIPEDYVKKPAKAILSKLKS